MVVFVVFGIIALIAIVGVYVYFKVIKPRQNLRTTKVQDLTTKKKAKKGAADG